MCDNEILNDTDTLTPDTDTVALHVALRCTLRCGTIVETP